MKAARKSISQVFTFHLNTPFSDYMQYLMNNVFLPECSVSKNRAIQLYIPNREKNNCKFTT